MDKKENSDFVPGKENFLSFIAEFMKETDRAAVVLGVAKLDLLLCQIIQKKLIPSPASKDELLKSDAALGTFSARIKIVYRLGLIDNGFVRSLHMLRKIRNDFAHEVAGCALNSGAHSDRVKELVEPFRDTQSFKELFEASKKMCKTSVESVEFRVVLGTLVIGLEMLYLACVPLKQNTTMTLDGVKSLIREDNLKEGE